MKYILLILTFVSSICIADTISDFKESLSPFQPISITMNNGNVLITTNEYRVTDTIYSAIINNGVCMPLWLGNSSSLDGVKSIMVLNKFKKQGYVFEGGADVCNKLGKLKSQQAKIYLMGNSHIY